MLQTVLCGAACAAAAYLLGSLSFSIIVTRLLYHKDIRTFGSGNAGMTNVLRTFGKGAAALTIVGDIGKGILAVLLAKWAFGAFTAADPIYGAYIAAFCAVLGHVYPVYFGFKGGKAVSVATGTIDLPAHAAVARQRRLVGVQVHPRLFRAEAAQQPVVYQPVLGRYLRGGVPGGAGA